MVIGNCCIQICRSFFVLIPGETVLFAISGRLFFLYVFLIIVQVFRLKTEG